MTTIPRNFNSSSPPRTWVSSDALVDWITLIPRVAYATSRTLLALPFFGLASLFHTSSFSDPKKITNKKIPIILIHGSGSNQRQWEIFRRVLASESCGHISSLNLNARALINDSKTIEEYAQSKLAQKIEFLRERYLKEASLNLNEVILIGHSMGGMVAGEYAIKPTSDVTVRAIVSLHTPWHGSYLADLLYSPLDKPGGALRTDNQASKQLRETLLQREKNGLIKIFTVSSTLDPHLNLLSPELQTEPPLRLATELAPPAPMMPVFTRPHAE